MPEKITHDEALEALKNAYSELLHTKGTSQVLSEDQIKDAMKLAFKELLDERMREFGYLSLKWIITFVAGGLLTFLGVKFGFQTK